MNNTVPTTITPRTVLSDLAQGDLFRWADPIDLLHDDVSIVLNININGYAEILNLSSGAFITRDVAPLGADADSAVDRVKLTGIQAVLA